MKRLACCTVLCLCLFVPSFTLAGPPDFGLQAISEVHPENKQEKHPKNLQLALVLTEKVKKGVPVSFVGYYENDNELNKGKVVLKLSVYRGEQRLWKRKSVSPIEGGDSFHDFCDAYDKGFDPGDMVVFDFKAKGVPRLGKTGGAGLLALMGSKEMWSIDYPYWSYGLECP